MMRLKFNLLSIFILCFLIIMSVNAFAQSSGNFNTNASQKMTGGYYISPYDLEPGTPIDSHPEAITGFNGITSFWQLPLWIKVFIVSAAGVTILGLFKLMPFVFGRLGHVLENSKTKDIFNYIIKNPGYTIAEISSGQSINRGTLKYHLQQLMTENKVISIRNGKFSRYFFNNMAVVDKESLISAYMRIEGSQKVLVTIMENPGITNQELSGRFELTKSTIHDYLSRFFREGLVESRQDGKYKRYYIKQDARLIMLRYRPQ
jgi:predicted transcriptional regulator